MAFRSTQPHMDIVTPRGAASGSAAGDEACSDEAWQGNVRKIAVPA